MNRLLGPDSVRYMSVTTAMQGLTAAHHDTQRDSSKTAREPRYTQAKGCFCRWWQVLGSNQRRLSRRFYRPLLFTPVIYRSGLPLVSYAPAQARSHPCPMAATLPGGHRAQPDNDRPTRGQRAVQEESADSPVLDHAGQGAVAIRPAWAALCATGVSTNSARSRETTGKDEH